MLVYYSFQLKYRSLKKFTKKKKKLIYYGYTNWVAFPVLKLVYSQFFTVITLVESSACTPTPRDPNSNPGALVLFPLCLLKVGAHSSLVSRIWVLWCEQRPGAMFQEKEKWQISKLNIRTYTLHMLVMLIVPTKNVYPITPRTKVHLDLRVYSHWLKAHYLKKLYCNYFQPAPRARQPRQVIPSSSDEEGFRRGRLIRSTPLPPNARRPRGGPPTVKRNGKNG